jgi:hypothetical protein
MPAWAPSEQTVFIAPRATSVTVVCDVCRTLGDGRQLGASVGRDLEVATFRCRRGHRLRIVRALPLPALG